MNLGFLRWNSNLSKNGECIYLFLFFFKMSWN